MGAMGVSGPDAAHLVVAVMLTYLLGFERDLRGAPTGDRVFALVGAGTGVVGIRFFPDDEPPAPPGKPAEDQEGQG